MNGLLPSAGRFRVLSAPLFLAACVACEGGTEWPGQGYSCVIDSSGKVLGMAKTTTGAEIVLADLPVRKAQEPPVEASQE